MKINLNWKVFLLLPLIGITIWSFSTPTKAGFANLTISLKSLGQISGILGITLFSTDLMLSARFKFLERYFKGLDKIYRYHHLIGGISFILLLFHPLLLALNYSFTDAKLALSLFLISKDLSINMGIISLSTMIIILVLTFFLKEKIAYQNWKLSHKLLGVIFLLGFFHSITAIPNTEKIIPLKIYILVIGSLGIFSYLYGSIFKKWLIKKTICHIASLRWLKENVLEIELFCQENHFNFIPGQFIFISFKNKDTGFEKHPFSITSGDSEKTLKIAVKKTGDYTSKLGYLKIGDEAEIEGPYGHFYSNQKKDEIWIAGGIGIAPFVSKMRSFKGSSENKIILFYSVKDKNDLVFENEIKKAGYLNKNFESKIHFSKENGRLTAQLVKDFVKDLNDKNIFICGPVKMIEDFENSFLKIGIRKEQIFSEKFQF